jgi:metal-responsive CopG/Arc/MetJ family transcriptional regulator
MGRIIPDQVKEKKRKLTVYLVESLAERLDVYLEYRGFSREHLVTHAVGYVLDKDEGFQKHLAERGIKKGSGRAKGRPSR